MPPLENSPDEVDSKAESLAGENIIFHCVLRDDQEALSK